MKKNYARKRVKIRHIEVFREIMDAGSITEAAKNLCISQPSASKHLKNFEDDLGIPMFERTGKRLIATAEAHELYSQLSRVYLGVKHLEDFANALRNKRQVNIAAAVIPLVAHHWLPDALEQFFQENEAVSVSLPVRSSDWILDAVAGAKLDFGISLMHRRHSGVESKVIANLPLVLVMRKEHQLNARKRIFWADLNGENLITLSNFDSWSFVVQRTLEKRNIRSNKCIETFSPQLACELARRGVGVGIVDGLTAREYVGAGLSIRQLEPEMTFDVCLVKPTHSRLSGSAMKLCNLITDHARQSRLKVVSEIS